MRGFLDQLHVNHLDNPRGNDALCDTYGKQNAQDIKGIKNELFALKTEGKRRYSNHKFGKQLLTFRNPLESKKGHRQNGRRRVREKT